MDAPQADTEGGGRAWRGTQGLWRGGGRHTWDLLLTRGTDTSPHICLCPAVERGAVMTQGPRAAPRVT